MNDYIKTKYRINKFSIKSMIELLMSKFRHAPNNLDHLKKILASANTKGIIDCDVLSIIDGSLLLSDKTSGEIMVPRSKMHMLEVSTPISEMVNTILESTHSRFPVFEGERDNVIGIVIAKELLRYISDPEITLKSLIRSAVFIPESKKLNILLREFRISRNHMAIVIDEHGGISGLITMEDVLEQIVGNIEDEFDNTENNSIFAEGPNQWIVMASTDINHFNDYIKTNLPNNDYDSVGGWLVGELNKIPQCGDKAVYEDLQLEVIRANARKALWLRVKRTQK
ncbi:MAG: CBS domain-containing protein [Candidatus Kinetoplastibacterium crithidii]|nr:CBS domain-containing protein [Candidatus Kinetoplastibacterium crithidii]